MTSSRDRHICLKHKNKNPEASGKYSKDVVGFQEAEELVSLECQDTVNSAEAGQNETGLAGWPNGKKMMTRIETNAHFVATPI